MKKREEEAPTQEELLLHTMKYGFDASDA